MSLFKKIFSNETNTNHTSVFEAIIKSETGPVLKVVMNDLHLATLYYDGNRYCIVYHEDFLGSGIAPFNPEQLKMNDRPEIDKVYYSDVLWHSFSARIPSSERPDFKALIKTLGLSGDENPLVILSKIGSISISKPWRLELVKNSPKVG